jgi:hypothetical protein
MISLTFLFAHLSKGGKLMITSISHLKVQKAIFRIYMPIQVHNKKNDIFEEGMILENYSFTSY